MVKDSEVDNDLNFKLKTDFYAIGKHLEEIKLNGTYKKYNKSFIAYCKNVLCIAKSSVYQYIKSAKVLDTLKNAGFKTLPKQEYQARLLSEFDEYEMIQVWNNVLNNLTSKKFDNETILKLLKEQVKKVKIKDLSKIKTKVNNKEKDLLNEISKLKTKIELFSNENQRLVLENSSLKSNLEHYKTLYLSKSSSKQDTWYEVLGISANASYEDLKKAHKTLLNQFHPDRVSSLGLTKEQMSLFNNKAKLIIEAYQKGLKKFNK